VSKPAPFGKYQILGELGRGGMGIVYEAMDAALGRKIAIKTMVVSPLAKPEEARMEGERFVREARLSAGLPKHPHIVGVYEVGVVDGRRYLAMERIEGKPMSEWRASETVTLRDEIEVLRLVALAVHHAHEHGVIHRDLKPQNILIDAKNEPHVTDFGLAKMVGENMSVSLTGAGMVVGTPAYISPEQAQASKTVDRRTDVYALGVMLFETITGRHPFTGDTPIELLMKASKNPVPSVSTMMKVRLTPVQTKGLDDICQKALAKKVADRYRDAAVFAADLDKWLKGQDVKVSLHTRRATGPKRSPLQMAAAVSVALMALVFILIQILSRPSTDAADAEQKRVEAVRLEAQRRIQEENLRAERDRLEATRRHLESLQPSYMKPVEVKEYLLKPGLIGEYFGGCNFEMLSLRRIDSEPRFSWKQGPSVPVWPEGPYENVSYRWQGYLRIDEKGPYAFHINASEGVRLSVDNVDVASSWPPRPLGPQSAVLFLEQGFHTVLLESFKTGAWGGSVWLTCKKNSEPGADNLPPNHFVHDSSQFTPLSRKVTWEMADRKTLPGAQEVEALKILESAPGATGVLNFATRGKGFLIWGKAKLQDRLVFQFDSPDAGEKTLILALGRSKNAGTVKVAVNGTVVFEKLDLYYQWANHFSEHEFKKVALRKGANELEFTMVGSNPQAAELRPGEGTMKFTMDYLRIR
jgi:serine/threonine protein kinase